VIARSGKLLNAPFTINEYLAEYARIADEYGDIEQLAANPKSTARRDLYGGSGNSLVKMGVIERVRGRYPRNERRFRLTAPAQALAVFLSDARVCTLDTGVMSVRGRMRAPVNKVPVRSFVVIIRSPNEQGVMRFWIEEKRWPGNLRYEIAFSGADGTTISIPNLTSSELNETVREMIGERGGAKKMMDTLKYWTGYKKGRTLPVAAAPARKTSVATTSIPDLFAALGSKFPKTSKDTLSWESENEGQPTKQYSTQNTVTLEGDKIVLQNRYGFHDHNYKSMRVELMPNCTKVTWRNDSVNGSGAGITHTFEGPCPVRAFAVDSEGKLYAIADPKFVRAYNRKAKEVGSPEGIHVTPLVNFVSKDDEKTMAGLTPLYKGRPSSMEKSAAAPDQGVITIDPNIEAMLRKLAGKEPYNLLNGNDATDAGRLQILEAIRRNPKMEIATALSMLRQMGLEPGMTQALYVELVGLRVVAMNGESKPADILQRLESASPDVRNVLLKILAEHEKVGKLVKDIFIIPGEGSDPAVVTLILVNPQNPSDGNISIRIVSSSDLKYLLSYDVVLNGVHRIQSHQEILNGPSELTAALGSMISDNPNVSVLIGRWAIGKTSATTPEVALEKVFARSELLRTKGSFSEIDYRDEHNRIAAEFNDIESDISLIDATEILTRVKEKRWLLDFNALPGPTLESTLRTFVITPKGRAAIENITKPSADSGLGAGIEISPTISVMLRELASESSYGVIFTGNSDDDNKKLRVLEAIRRDDSIPEATALEALREIDVKPGMEGALRTQLIGMRVVAMNANFVPGEDEGEQGSEDQLKRQKVYMFFFDFCRSDAMGVYNFNPADHRIAWLLVDIYLEKINDDEAKARLQEMGVKSESVDALIQYIHDTTLDNTPKPADILLLQPGFYINGIPVKLNFSDMKGAIDVAMLKERLGLPDDITMITVTTDGKPQVFHTINSVQMVDLAKSSLDIRFSCPMGIAQTLPAQLNPEPYKSGSAEGVIQVLVTRPQLDLIESGKPLGIGNESIDFNIEFNYAGHGLMATIKRPASETHQQVAELVAATIKGRKIFDGTYPSNEEFKAALSGINLENVVTKKSTTALGESAIDKAVQQMMRDNEAFVAGLRLPNVRQGTLEEEITEYVEEQVRAYGADAVPGLEFEDWKRLYAAVEMLRREKMEILTPQRVKSGRFKLTDATEKTLDEVERKVAANGGSLSHKEFDENSIVTQLESDKSVKRMIIVDDAYKDFIQKLLADRPDLFENVRIYNMSLYSDYAGMKDIDKSVCQARAITLAILMRLHEDGNKVTETLLLEMLKDRIDAAEMADEDMMGKTPVKYFISKIPEKAGEDTHDRVKRLNGFLLWHVSLVEKLGKQLRLLEKFVWCAA
jgi:hypothetical protein